MIYLDYAAHTPCDNKVLECFCETERMYGGNPNSGHSEGKKARDFLYRVTEETGALFNVNPSDIIFLSGATEANNLAIKGIIDAKIEAGNEKDLGFRNRNADVETSEKAGGKTNEKAGGKTKNIEIITSPFEHSSVKEVLKYYEKKGIKIIECKVDNNGKIDLEDLKTNLNRNTALVCVCAIDSELGIIQDIDNIGKIIKENSHAYFHVDATQMAGKYRFNSDNIDTISMSGHKIYGITGSGILIKKRHVKITPQIMGGDSLTRFRSSTPQTALIASMGCALKAAYKIMDEEEARIRELNEYLRDKLLKLDYVRINSPVDASSYILNISFDNLRGMRMMEALSKKGIMISVKAACSSNGQPSYPVMLLYGDRRRAMSSVRISLGKYTDKEQLDKCVEALQEIYREEKIL